MEMKDNDGGISKLCLWNEANMRDLYTQKTIRNLEPDLVGRLGTILMVCLLVEDVGLMLQPS